MRLFVITIMFLAFCSLPLTAAAGDAKAGGASYKKSCGSCHEADGAPKAAVAKMMKVEMRHLGAAEVQAKSDADLRKDILEGTGKMKAVKGLNEQQSGDLVAFMRTLKQ